MTNYLENFWFSASHLCHEFPAGYNTCQPPSACATDSRTGKDYCCDTIDVCWTYPSQNSTKSCGDFSCLDNVEVCNNDNQNDVCWSSNPDILLDISISALNNTYESLSSASPSATAWGFNPQTLISATTTASTSSTSTSTTSGASPTTAASTTSAAPSTPSSSSSLSGGAIAGIVIGAIAAVAIIFALAYYIFRQRQKTGYIAGDIAGNTAGDITGPLYQLATEGSKPPLVEAGYQDAVIHEFPDNMSRGVEMPTN